MGIGLHEEENLFARAIELPRAARGAFLRAACGEDESLRQRVEQLIEAHESAGAIIDRPYDEADAIRIVVRGIMGRRSGEDD